MNHCQYGQFRDFLSLSMSRIKIYKIEFFDENGTVQESITFEALNHKEAERKAQHYKRYGLPYPGSGRLRTVIKLTGKL